MQSATANPNENAFGRTAPETALEAENDHALRVPFFCEENVWRLAYKKTHEQPHNHLFIVFVSNSIKSVPMFQQQACEEPGKACCWDYHVILVCLQEQPADTDAAVLVYDIDSRLPYPCPIQDYLAQSFPYEWPLPCAPMFRIVPARLFLQHFSNDRLHMYNERTQTWNAPLPPYQCILTRPSNLKDYLNFCERPRTSEPHIPPDALGTILTLTQFKHYDFVHAATDAHID